MKKESEKTYQNLIEKVLKILNKDNVFLIIHDASFPSLKEENTGIGTPFSQTTKELMAFLKLHGINGIQLGPNGITKLVELSPYTGTLFSNSFLFINLYQLTQSLFGSILSKESFNKIVQDNPNKQDNKIAYNYIYIRQKQALEEAYNNFRDKLRNIKKLDKENSKQLTKIEQEIEEFKLENKYWLDKDAFYEALSVKHQNDYWPLWEDETDKNLFVYLKSNDKSLKSKAKKRIEEIEESLNYELELYKFIQFICYKQKTEFKQFSKKKGFKLIADTQIAVSDRDLWANQSLFLENYYLGASPDHFSEVGQAWGFPVINPDTIFKENGELAEGGNFLKNKFLKIFKENDGVRVDHIIGLIDPWVYLKNEGDARFGGGRLYSSPDIDSLSKYSYITKDDLNNTFLFEPGNEHRVEKLTENQISKYSQLIEKIVFMAAKEADKKDDFILICEDIGTITFPVIKVMEKFKLSGIRITQIVDPNVPTHFYRGSNVDPRHWIVMGTHDNDTLINWTRTLTNKEKTDHIYLLIEDLFAHLNDKSKQNIARKAFNDIEEFRKLKVAELFASPARNVQIMFTDFFGMEERYNIPGTTGNHNWSLRILNDYNNFYYNQLSKGYGINLPEVLTIAMESKGSNFVNQHNDLIEKLKRFSTILKHK